MKKNQMPQIGLPADACERSGFTDKDTLELHAGQNALVFMKDKMTALEVANAIQSLSALAADLQQGIPQADMVFFREAVLAHVFVIAFGFKIRRVAVEKADRAVILPYQLFKIFIFNHYFTKSSMCLFN